MKTRTFLIAAVMFVGLSAVAFAQATFTIGSVPVTAVENNIQTAKTGNITFTMVAGSSPTIAGTFTVSYAVPITNSVTTSAAISVINNLTGGGGVSITSVSNSSGQVVLTLVAGATGGSFTLAGVRVAPAGTTITTLSATVSAVGNAILAGQTSVVVINSVAAGLSGVSLPTGEAAVLVNAVSRTRTYSVGDNLRVRIREGFLNTYLNTTQEPSNSVPVTVRLTLNQIPPAGVTITFPATADARDTVTTGNPLIAGAFETANADGSLLGTTVAIDSVTNPVLTVYYRVSSTSPSTSVVEDMQIPITVSVSPFAAVPIPSAQISVTATLAPIGAAFGAFNAVLAGPFPRYAATEVGPTTIVSIPAANTTMLIPFAARIVSSGYDTGIAIANTTTDPGATVLGFVPVAVKQSGTITFYFYPQTGTAFSLTTSSTSPGTGLTAGSLATGGTYTVLLSQLLAAASAPADFTGYIIAMCNFTNSHGQYLISDFKGFTNGSQILVIPNTRAAPEGVNQ
jgi:hypothetical protein